MPKCQPFSSGLNVMDSNGRAVLHTKQKQTMPLAVQCYYTDATCEAQRIQSPQTSLKTQCESNILSTHTPFIPCQWALPFL